MTDRTLTRSRRDTPQSPPKSNETINTLQQPLPRRTTRGARSHSRDLSDHELERVDVKIGKRSTRQNNAQDAQGSKVEKNMSKPHEIVNAQSSTAQGNEKLFFFPKNTAKPEIPIIALD